MGSVCDLVIPEGRDAELKGSPLDIVPRAQVRGQPDWSFPGANEHLDYAGARVAEERERP